MPVVKLWDLHTTIFKFMKASYQILNLFRKTSKKMLIEKSHSYGGGNATGQIALQILLWNFVKHL